MTLVRIATVQDADAIAHVHVQAWRTTYAGIVPEAYLDGLDESKRAASWREQLINHVEVFVADSDDEIVGFACGGLIREPLPGCDAELYAIYVLKHAQGRGIGTALLEAVTESLRASGLRSMAVWVLERNASSSFYQRSGASLVSTSKKEIEIGGAVLPLSAYMWPDLTAIPST